MIQDGTVTAIETSGLRDRLGKILDSKPRRIETPVVIRSHGGRARAIESGEVHIDVALWLLLQLTHVVMLLVVRVNPHVVRLAAKVDSPLMQIQLLLSQITWLTMYTTMQSLKLM